MGQRVARTKERVAESERLGGVWYLRALPRLGWCDTLHLWQLLGQDGTEFAGELALSG